MFHNIFDTVPERPVDKSDNLYFILDGGSLIHRVVWPKQETFGDVHTTCTSYIKGKISREIILNESTVLIDSQRQFLSNLANKEFHFANFVATDDADIHIVKTAIETYEKIKIQVVVISQDVDLLVLLNALTPNYMDILMLKEGKCKIKDRFYSSKDLRNCNLVIEYKKSILFLHAISGCDTTSRFYGKGKLQAVQLFNHSKYLYMYT
ncbi:hypothetical protein AVEN_218881-1 [Araneus ventricosus]|uniref:Uncharacterized protein n=1 Tax=Araneus ventricosus TaxID=182803 RepID=A0A4Y2UI11_ARAVE|nr:hypothetical protein AVEN_8700-1 [Araneus ventricosus]GBO11751.1 hypothetical protein AVEN_218881-1 [Araneus ventricosus]